MKTFAALLALALSWSTNAVAQVSVNDGAQNVALRPIIPQTRTNASRIGAQVDLYAVFPGVRAEARTGATPSFIVPISSAYQPQSLVTLASLSVRGNAREVYIGGGQGAYAIHAVKIVPTQFSPAADQTSAPAGTTLYTISPQSRLAAGEYVLVVVEPSAPMPYGGMPADYFDFGVD